MDLTNGQTIYLAFATSRASCGNPVAFVNRATVLDAENSVVRRENGLVSVLDVRFDVETVHATADEAWGAAASKLEAAAEAICAVAAECRAKAAATGRIVAVTA